MGSSEGIDAGDSIDTLLDHQTQRLEDIANNAVDFIKINLLVLGAFVPFIATTLGDEIPSTSIFNSNFIIYSTLSWVASAFFSVTVYRTARKRSTSQFQALENAIVDEWSEQDFRGEIIDNSSEYEDLVGQLMVALSVSIGLSLVAILFLAAGLYDILLGIRNNSQIYVVVAVMTFGALVGLGTNILSRGRRSYNWIMASASRSTIDQTEGSGFPSVEDGRSGGLEYLAEEEGLSKIRGRLLKAIYDTAGEDTWTYSEIANRLEEKYPSIGLTRSMLERLRTEGYLKKIEQSGPDFYVINEREEEVINGQELDDAVSEEIGRLIGHIKNDREVRELAADYLGTDPDQVVQVLFTSPTSGRIDNLNDIVDLINEEYPDKTPDGENYGKLCFKPKPIDIY